MGTTSRRAFAKWVAGAIAAIPVGSFASQVCNPPQTARKRTRRKKTTRKVVLECYESHENTPPPVSVIDGSLHFRVKHNSGSNPFGESGGAQTWYYRGNVNEAKPNMFEHIKVLHGSGELLYCDLAAAGSVITIQAKDEQDDRVGTLTLTGQNNEFQIKSVGYGNGNGNGRLSHSMGPGKPKKKHTLQHRGGDSSRDFRITGINITGGSVGGKEIVLPPVSTACPFESKELRVLIWFAD